MNIEGLDKLDHAILETIREHARMSYSDIGDKVGLSRVAVKNRMEAMEKQGSSRAIRLSLMKQKLRKVFPLFLMWKLFRRSMKTW